MTNSIFRETYDRQMSCVLLLDNSESKLSEPIHSLNQEIFEFKTTCDEKCDSHNVENLCIISSGSESPRRGELDIEILQPAPTEEVFCNISLIVNDTSLLAEVVKRG